MNTERRCTSRQRPEELSYIQFQPEGGGIVVNASEQGLAFHAAAALRQTGPIQLSVSPNPMQQIKLSAEIVWIDETKKSGGVRFRALTEDAKNQILQWLTQPRQVFAPDKELMSLPSTVLEDAGPRLHTEKGTTHLRSPVPNNAEPAVPDSVAPPPPRILGSLSTARLSAIFPRERQVSIIHSRLLRGLAAGLLSLVFLSVSVYLLRHFRHEIGGALIRTGERLTGNRDTPLEASSSKQAQTSNPSSVTTSPVADPTPGVSAKQTLDHSDSVVSPQTAQQNANSPDSPSVGQNSPKPMVVAHARKGRSELARHLWSALNAGDSSAEIPLAQLYLTGDGVPRSCDQARVLLSAASKKGNTEALRQLQQLKKNTCR
jgi:PilZ domain